MGLILDMITLERAVGVQKWARGEVLEKLGLLGSGLPRARDMTEITM